MRIVAWGPLMKMLDERREKIAREPVRRRAGEGAGRGVRAPGAGAGRAARREGQQLIAQAQEISTRIQADARTQAQADAEATLARARNEIQQERDAAIADLRSEFADLTISAAEKVINQSLDRNAHQRLIEEALAESSFAGGNN